VTGDFLLLGACLFLSGFFSSTETALTALSEARARQLMEQKPSLARYLNLWLERPNRVLTLVLIGNNVVNTFTAALATLLSQHFFSTAALSIAVGLTTLAILIAGEITPKTFAKHNAARLAPVAMRFMWLLYMFPPIKWMVIALTGVSKAIVQITGGELTRSGPFITEEDISFLLELGSQQGAIEPEESEIITNALEFGDTIAREVMIPRREISALKIGTSLDEVVREIDENGHTRLPIYGEDLDDIRGFLHAKDLLQVLGHAKATSFRLEDHVRAAVFVPELERLSELLKRFRRSKTHLAVVVDEHGATAGIVSLEDLIEELVGEIQDEHDEEEESDIMLIDENRWLALGKTNINELGDELGIRLPDDERYDTLGGFLIAQHGKMPLRGTRVEFDGWSFVAREVDQRRVHRVEIERIPEDQQAA
jgi:CBS domain containing-hemolysin-like protein